MSDELTIDKVNTVLSSKRFERGMVHCVFTCPESGKSFNSSGSTGMSANSAVGRIAQRTGSSLFYRLRYALMRGASRLVGGGFLGELTGQAAYAASDEVDLSSLSPGARNKAILSAFEQVAPFFTWDEDRKSFVAREMPGERA